MIGLCLLMAGDDSRMAGGESRMAGGESRMAGGESRMAGDCCRADAIQPDLYIDTYERIHTCTPYIYGLVGLLDSTIKLLKHHYFNRLGARGLLLFLPYNLKKEPQEP
jgi:hypothetical protein